MQSGARICIDNMIEASNEFDVRVQAGTFMN